MFDFGLGASELLFIAIVALIVVGPKDLPRLLRTIGQYARKIRGLAREFQTHLDEASKEAGLDDVKKEVKGMTNFTVTSDLDKQGKDLDKHGNDIKRAMEDTTPKSSASAKAAGNAAPGNGKATTAVQDAIAESEAAKPETAAKRGADKPGADKAKPQTASKGGTAKAEKPKSDKAKADKPKADKKADKAKPAAKPKPQAGRSHETVKS